MHSGESVHIRLWKRAGRAGLDWKLSKPSLCNFGDSEELADLAGFISLFMKVTQFTVWSSEAPFMVFDPSKCREKGAFLAPDDSACDQSVNVEQIQ